MAVKKRAPRWATCSTNCSPKHGPPQTYLWRWDIEVNFRDQTTRLGGRQAQARHPQAVQRVPATAVALFSSRAG